MKRSQWLLLGVVLGLSLLVVLSVSADAGGVTSLYSVIPCKDSTTAVADVYSTYVTNRLRVSVYYQDDNGEYKFLRDAKSSAFGSGGSRVMVNVVYIDQQVSAYKPLRIDVQLERSYGVGNWTNVGPMFVHYVGALDKLCAGACSAVVETSDLAPSDGTITLRSRYGSWFRPEGSLLGAQPVTRNSRALLTFAGLPCDWTVRAWYYPKTGNTTPQLLPSQYWPSEYAVNQLGGTNPYVTSFAAGLPATAPLEEDDPFVVDPN
jgi:hypothetical protein